MIQALGVLHGKVESLGPHLSFFVAKGVKIPSALIKDAAVHLLIVKLKSEMGQDLWIQMVSV